MDNNDNNYSGIQSLPDVLSDHSGLVAPVSSYRCGKCNAFFSLDSSEKASNCIFCGNPNLSSENLTLEQDYYIVPFIKTRETAIKNYKRIVMCNPFIPLCFKKKSIIQSMKKVYIPGYLLDVHAAGKILFYAVDEGKGKEKEQQKFEVLFDTNFDYSKVLVNQSSLISLSLFEMIFSEKNPSMRDYDSDLLKDIYVVQPDLSAEDISNQLRERIMKKCVKTVKNNVHHQLKKLQQNDIAVSSNDVRKVLFPVYFLSVSYKDKNYYYLMNGANGKNYLEPCYGKLEIAFVSIIIFVFVFLISYLIVYFL